MAIGSIPVTCSIRISRPGASSAVDFLFSAARGCQTDLPVVLLRAHAAREGGETMKGGEDVRIGGGS